MIGNRDISRMFSLYAELLLLHEKDQRLAGLLSGAAYRTRKLPEEISSLNKKELNELFKPQIVALLNELKGSGRINELDELIHLTPAGLFEMMRIRGLGGKKLSLLWRAAKIDSIDALLEACKKHQVREIPGFGVKTEQNIIQAIESYTINKDRFHYASVADAADQLVLAIQKIFKTKLVSLCGESRRHNTTVECIEIIADITSNSFNVSALRKWMIVQSSTNNITTGHTLDEIPVIVYHTSAKKFFFELFQRTGNESHVRKVSARLTSNTSFESEAAIYKKAGIPFILPELREDVAEWHTAGDDLITLKDIKGVVHNHTTWSDGVDSLADFANACKKKQYQYVVISDHSKNAHYAGGLKEEKVLQQMSEIDRLNKQLAPFKIFKSIECDILVSGELDYNDALLKKFDLVIISIHQLLKMDEEKSTKRLIRAIENPYTTILGHMTGRQLLIRPGYPVNFKKVIDACAANKVVIEINANPYRLDMDWTHIPYAMKKGVMISINPDAHSIFEIDNIRWGVAAARKGGLTRDMTWNAMPLTKIESWLRDKKITLAQNF